jgi:hypothetical protein
LILTGAEAALGPTPGVWVHYVNWCTHWSHQFL